MNSIYPISAGESSSNGSPRIDIELCKARLPMPALMQRLGLGDHAKRSTRSPFREDNNQSWGIYSKDGRWFFKDFATGETGDELHLLALHKGLSLAGDFRAVAASYAELAGCQPIEKPPIKKETFKKGTKDQLQRLAMLREFSAGIAGLEFAQDRGCLVFGVWHGAEVWGVTDSSGRVLELRRMDGAPFPAVGRLSERKSHSCKGSQKKWPVGILEALGAQAIALVEGGPDFIEAHALTVHEKKEKRVAPVAMMAGSVAICDEALPHFAGKHVRIYPHVDPTGFKAADLWKKQLVSAGAARVDLFGFHGLKQADGSPVEDLNDFARLSPEDAERDPSLSEVLP